MGLSLAAAAALGPGHGDVRTPGGALQRVPAAWGGTSFVGSVVAVRMRRNSGLGQQTFSSSGPVAQLLSRRRIASSPQLSSLPGLRSELQRIAMAAAAAGTAVSSVANLRRQRRIEEMTDRVVQNDPKIMKAKSSGAGAGSPKQFVGGEEARYTGRMKFWDPIKGFGYIALDNKPKGVPEEVLVRRQDVDTGGEKSLQWTENLEVECGVYISKTGTARAHQVTLPGGAPVEQEDGSTILRGKMRVKLERRSEWQRMRLKEGRGFMQKRDEEEAPAGAWSQQPSRQEFQQQVSQLQEQSKDQYQGASSAAIRAEEEEEAQQVARRLQQPQEQYQEDFGDFETSPSSPRSSPKSNPSSPKSNTQQYQGEEEDEEADRDFETRGSRGGSMDEEEEYRLRDKPALKKVPKPLRASADLLMTGLKVDPRKAARTAAAVQRWAVLREGEDATGAATRRWTRRLLRGLEMHPAVRPMLFAPGGVVKCLKELESRSERHTERFTAIQLQHEEVRQGNEGDLEEYSEASAYMGNEWWLRAVHERMIGWMDDYFLLSPEKVLRGHPWWAFDKGGGLPTGWKRYNPGGRGSLYWNPDAKKMQREAPGLSGEERVPPVPREPPVALLDIGSNSNRFQDFPFFVKPFPLDLQPAPNAAGVLKADFFKVPIVEDEALRAAGEHWITTEAGSKTNLEGIVAGSFDAAVISLVLSYVPDPQKRIEMIARARRCLKDDRGLLFVVEVGSALADASWYEQDAAAEWSRALESAGFKLLKFEDEVVDRHKRHKLLQWVLETAPIKDDVELKPMTTPKDLGLK